MEALIHQWTPTLQFGPWDGVPPTDPSLTVFILSYHNKHINKLQKIIYALQTL